MPQEILDERPATLDERIERWRGVLGQDQPPWLFENAEGLVGSVSIGPTRGPRHRHPPQLSALYVRAGYWGTGVGYALFKQVVGDRTASLRMLANNERRSRSTSGRVSPGRDARRAQRGTA